MAKYDSFVLWIAALKGAHTGRLNLRGNFEFVYNLIHKAMTVTVMMEFHSFFHTALKIIFL